MAPDAHVEVMSGNPAYFSSRYGVSVFRARHVPTIWQKLRWSDALILGGGGTLFDLSVLDTLRVVGHSQLAVWTGMTILAARLSKPVLWYELGIGPLTFGLSRVLVGVAARSTASIVVRDRNSQQILSSVGIDNCLLGADPVWRCALPTGPRIPGLPPNYVLVILRHWKSLEDEDTITGLLRALVQPNRPVVVTVTNPRRDCGFAARMSARTGLGVLCRPAESSDRPAVLVELIRRAEAVYSMRMHGLIIAARLGVPCVGLQYRTPKVRLCMSDIGRADQCIDLADKHVTSDLGERIMALDPQSADDAALNELGELADLGHAALARFLSEVA